jgi:protein TonB
VPAKRAPLSAAARTQAAVTSPAAAKAQTTTATADSEIPLITDPRYRRPPQPPAYPSQSVRRNEEGTALIRARISSLGDVLEVRVFESSGSALLDKSALAAVRRWLFVPASRSGQPSEAWVQVPVHFRLDE